MRARLRQLVHTKYARVIAAVFSGTLLGVAQSPTPHALLAIFALVPWVLASRASSRFREVAIQASFFALAYGFVVIHWLPAALRGLQLDLAWAPFLVVACSLWAALPVFLPTGLMLFLTRTQSAAISTLSVAVTLGLCEAVHSSWALSIPWALVGHSQIDFTATAQLALVHSVSLLSAFVVGINVAFALAIEHATPQRIRFVACAGAAWISLAFWNPDLLSRSALPGSDSETLRVLIVQPNIPREERWISELQALNVDRAASLTRRALNQTGLAVDAVIWPENLVTTSIDDDATLFANLQSQVDSLDVPIIMGVVRNSTEGRENRYRSSVVWWSPKSGIIDSMDKERAVPLIEAAPRTPLAKWLTSLLGIGIEAKQLESSSTSSDLRGPFAITSVLCWESLFADLVSNRRMPDSRLIAILADDSWVAGDSATQQLVDFARFRAIEQRLPLIRVAHGGLSVSVNPFGQVIDQLPMDAYAHSVVELPPPVMATAIEKGVLLSIPLASSFGVWCIWSVVARLFGSICVGISNDWRETDEIQS